MRIAIVSGASSGIGRAFVLELDKRRSFDEIWLIARREDRLVSLAKELKTKARAIPLDLSRMEDVQRYGELLDDEKPSVDVLFCCSGFGTFRAFMDRPLSEHLSMIDVNVKALVAMTYYTIPYMHSGSELYEMGSLGAFQPVPYEAVYTSSKAMVLSFSRALGRELKPRGIRVMCVCPGWVKTEFFDTAVSDDTVKYYDRWYTPEQVVMRAFSDMKKGRDVSTVGFPVRLQVLLVKLLPHSIVMNTWLKQQGLKR